jgi:hypothetical protein
LTVQIAGDSSREFLAVLLQRTGEARDLVGRESQLLRVDPDGVNRSADGERLTVPIGDGSTVRGNRRYARDTRITLLREKGVIDELQTYGAPDQPAGAAGKQAH